MDSAVTTTNVFISIMSAMGMMIVLMTRMSGKIYALRKNVKIWGGFSVTTKSALRPRGSVTGYFVGIIIVVMIPMRGRVYAIRKNVRS